MRTTGDSSLTVATGAATATFTSEVPTHWLAIARAIAKAMNAEREPEDGAPFIAADILEHARQEGLIALEKRWLGTRSLDHSLRGDRWDNLPKTTPAMLALVKTAGGGDIAA